MNNSSTQARLRNRKRDALQGAPGHLDIDMADESVNTAKSVKAVKSALTPSPDASPAMMDDVFNKLGAVFGDANVQKWRKLLADNTPDAEATLQKLISSAMASLPKDFSMPDLSAIGELSVVKTAKKRPVASAATVAVGVGALYLLREYLMRGTNPATTVKSAVNSVVKAAGKASKSVKAAKPAKKSAAKKTSKSSSKKSKNLKH